NQFVVRISKSAIKQLEPFLTRNSTVRDVMRDHLHIEAIDGSRTKSTTEASLGGILGQVSKQGSFKLPSKFPSAYKKLEILVYGNTHLIFPTSKSSFSHE
ncbi:hypothetical protein WUBG_12119, partial [Wuchereria bancrofti]